MRQRKNFTLPIFALLLITTVSPAQLNNPKPRTIVTTDGEVDDMDSFIRLLYYTDGLNLVGLIYSASEFHYAGDGKGTTFTSNMPWAKQYGTRTDLRWLGTQWMQDYIDQYAKVYPNLILHDKNYPTPQHLKSLVRVGNIEFEGEMTKDTDGSNFIRNMLLDNNTEPVLIQMWGGTNTVARALKSIEDTYKNSTEWPSIQKKINDKLVLYIILDQDETYTNYVSKSWPDLTIILSTAQFWSFAYAWKPMAPQVMRPYLGGTWFAENIKFNHGPLLASYFLWGDGQKLAGDFDHTHGDTVEVREKKMTQYDFISEGDSPSYLHLVDVGLRNIEDISYGGWGGRMTRTDNPHVWQDGDKSSDFNPYTQKMDKTYPQTRWFDAMQNDFAARADWGVKSYNEANHSPVVKLKHANNITAAAGDVVKLEGTATDPDKNKVTYKWWQYFDVDSYEGKISIDKPLSAKASFVVPGDAKRGDTIHVILEVTDDGMPSLTRYQRVIVTVK
jgi:hypothetical protein